MTTLGTRLLIWWKGEPVGEDRFGNQYYIEKGSLTRAWRRRWVVYKGEAEASKVPPEWHGWLHYMVDAPPSEAPPPTQEWEQPHLPNLSGTAHAYHPPGDMVGGAHPEGMPAPYQAWRPEKAAE